MAVARATMRPAAARAHARVPSSCICRPAVPAARPRPGACCAVDTTEATTAKVLEEPEAAAGGVAGGGGAAAAAAAGDPAAAADDLAASRRYTSFLPPFFSRATALEALGEGLWGVTQPLKPPGQPDIRVRMTVAEMATGDLLVVAPVAPTGEALAMLRGLGSGVVRHIVVPNTSPEHYLFTPAFAAAWPDATVWLPPGFLVGAGTPLPGRSWLFGACRARCRELGVDALPAELVGELEAVVLRITLFLEAAILLPRHSALCLADTAVCLSASDPEYATMNAWLARKIGVYDRLGPITGEALRARPAEARAWATAVLARDFELVVPAHGSAPVRGGRAAFEDCFAFVLGE